MRLADRSVKAISPLFMRRLIGRPKYAVKIVNKSKFEGDEQEKESLRTEIAILKLVNHSCIMKMKDMFESPTHFYIVMALLEGGDLYDRMVQFKRFEERTAKIIVWKILDAVSYLHTRGIVHRDLKLANILMRDASSEYDIILSDFGLSRFASPTELMNMPCGTLAYVAPEVLTMQGYTQAVDLWSVGIIAYLLLAGTLPFDVEDKRDVIEQILHGQLRFTASCWQDISHEAIELITGLLQKQPKDRFTMSQALKHQWFRDVEKLIKEGPPERKSQVGALPTLPPRLPPRPPRLSLSQTKPITVDISTNNTNSNSTDTLGTFSIGSDAEESEKN